MALLAAAWVQLNDPDPVVWVLIYGLAAAVSAMAALGRAPGVLAGVLGLLSLAWVLNLAPGLRPVSWAELSTEAPMIGDHVELARETGGLLLVALAMLAVRPWS